jgi:hypothetical protein
MHVITELKAENAALKAQLAEMEFEARELLAVIKPAAFHFNALPSSQH